MSYHHLGSEAEGAHQPTADRALVNGAPAGLHPTGFDPLRDDLHTAAWFLATDSASLSGDEADRIAKRLCKLAEAL